MGEFQQARHESARITSRFHFVPVCGAPEQTGTKWNLEAPCRTTRLRGSLPIRRLQIGLGLLYRTLKHTNKPQVRAPVRCQGRIATGPSGHHQRAKCRVPSPGIPVLLHNETCLAKAGAMSERHNDLARGDIMECAGRALSGDGALASGVANSVLIEAITCAGRSANDFTASSPEHTQDLRTFSWNKTRLPNPSDAVVGQHAGVQHVSLAAVGLPKEGLQRTESPSKHAERACGKRLWTRCSTSERQPEPATLTPP